MPYTNLTQYPRPCCLNCAELYLKHPYLECKPWPKRDKLTNELVHGCRYCQAHGWACEVVPDARKYDLMEVQQRADLFEMCNKLGAPQLVKDHMTSALKKAQEKFGTTSEEEKQARATALVPHTLHRIDEEFEDAGPVAEIRLAASTARVRRDSVVSSSDPATDQEILNSQDDRPNYWESAIATKVSDQVDTAPITSPLNGRDGRASYWNSVGGTNASGHNIPFFRTILNGRDGRPSFWASAFDTRVPDQVDTVSINSQDEDESSNDWLPAIATTGTNAADTASVTSQHEDEASNAEDRTEFDHENAEEDAEDEFFDNEDVVIVQAPNTGDAAFDFDWF